jgi:hypothetical protein
VCSPQLGAAGAERTWATGQQSPAPTHLRGACASRPGKCRVLRTSDELKLSLRRSWFADRLRAVTSPRTTCSLSSGSRELPAEPPTPPKAGSESSSGPWTPHGQQGSPRQPTDAPAPAADPRVGHAAGASPRSRTAFASWLRAATNRSGGSPYSSTTAAASLGQGPAADAVGGASAGVVMRQQKVCAPAAIVAGALPYARER